MRVGLEEVGYLPHRPILEYLAVANHDGQAPVSAWNNVIARTALRA
jgi:hypothetical protein